MRFERWPQDHLRVETGDFVADISKIRAELSWSPRVSLRGGLALTTAAQRAQPRAAVPRRATQPAASVPPRADSEPIEAALREAA
jgi:hypothetical protein